MRGGRGGLLPAREQVQRRDVRAEAVGDRGRGQRGEIAEGRDPEPLQQVDRLGEVEASFGTAGRGLTAMAPAGADGRAAQCVDRVRGEVLGAAALVHDPARPGGEQRGEGTVGDPDGAVPAGEVGDRVEDPLGESPLPALVAGRPPGGHQQHPGAQHVHPGRDRVHRGGDQLEQRGLLLAVGLQHERLGTGGPGGAARHPRAHPGLEGGGAGMGDAVLVEQDHRDGGVIERGRRGGVLLPCGGLEASLVAVQRGQQRPVRDGHGDGAGRPGGGGVDSSGAGRGGGVEVGGGVHAHHPALRTLGRSCIAGRRSETAAGRAAAPADAPAGTAASIPSTCGSSTSADR